MQSDIKTIIENTQNKELSKIAEKVVQGKRLTEDEGITLFEQI